ncbi:MAG: WbqC family protein [Bacteroidetes bacterium]|nr:WbqC family protein [Bacteroidota bacterium]
MKVAVMQPYLFPYIGYFQLAYAVDKFVFYDDVNFIKKGWINKNNILVNGAASSFTVPLTKVSQNKRINETAFATEEKWFKSFEQTLFFNYKNAPFYNETMEVVLAVLELRKNVSFISELAAASVKNVSGYLGIETVFENSSEKYSATKGMEKAMRLIEITKLNGSDQYINPLGGAELYSKEEFILSGIHLEFIKPGEVRYRQFKEPFVPWLSIIDVMMFNSAETIKNNLLPAYSLI